MNKHSEEGHLDLLRIDALRTGEGTKVDAGHLESCPRCQALLEEIEAGSRLLRNSPPPETAVPPGVDETILGAYRRRFVAPSRRWRLPAYGAAAAAVLALAVSTPLLRHTAKQPSEAPPPVAETADTRSALAGEDVNGDGRLDILDAFRLARVLKEDGAIRVQEDFNGDGLVNRIDVDILAHRAVSL